MTGYQSKKDMAQDKLEPWDNEAFSNWWDADYDDRTNPYEKDSFAYWAWAGWQAALAQSAQEPVATLFGTLPVYDTTPSQEREALKLALDVLENLPGFRADIDNAITAIKEVLEENT